VTIEYFIVSLRIGNVEHFFPLKASMNFLCTGILFTVLLQAAAWPEDKTTVESFSGSIQRKMTYQAKTISVSGHVHFDAVHERTLYDYDNPFHYRFILSDTSLFGLDKKNKSGYALRGSGETLLSDPVVRSVNILGPFFSYAFSFNFEKQKILASLDTCILYKVGHNTTNDIVAMHRIFDMPVIIESFDKNDRMIYQLTVSYDYVRNCKPMPRRFVVGTLCDNVFTTDTIVVTHDTYNTGIREKAFSVDRKFAIREIVSGAADSNFPFVLKARSSK